MTLGWLYHFKKESFRSAAGKIYLLPVGIVLSSSAFLPDQSSFWIYTVGLTANLLGFACVVMWAVEHPVLGRLKPIAMIGTFSYSIYLWHWPLWQVVEGSLGVTSTGFWAYVFASIVTGMIMAKAVEAPSLRFRDHVLPKQQRPVRESSVEPNNVAVGAYEPCRDANRF